MMPAHLKYVIGFRDDNGAFQMLADQGFEPRCQRSEPPAWTTDPLLAQVFSYKSEALTVRRTWSPKFMADLKIIEYRTAVKMLAELPRRIQVPEFSQQRPDCWL